MAVFPVAPGNPDYGTGGTSQYIPAIYSALLIDKFYPTTVWNSISNTKYSGDIKSFGDTVYIRTRAAIDTFKYKKGMVLPIQNPEAPYITLKINQGEGFSFAIDKVDEFQSDINLMNTFADDGAQQQKQVIDKNSLACLAGIGGATMTGYDVTDSPLATNLTIAGGYAAGQTALVYGGASMKSGTIAATGQGAATSPWGTLGNSAALPSLNTIAVSGTWANPGDWLVDRFLYYGQLLDENNVPDTDRFIVAPMWAVQRIKSVQAKLGQAYITGDASSPTRSGKIGGIDRFTIIGSNNVPNVSTGYPIFFGHKYALTFATQMTESRMIDNPYAFGKIMQALQVYGFQLIKPGFVGVDWIAQ